MKNIQYSSDYLMMQIIKDKNEIGRDQAEKPIIDPTIDFNKRLDMQSLNKKFGKHSQKFMILKVSKIETL